MLKMAFAFIDSAPYNNKDRGSAFRRLLDGMTEWPARLPGATEEIRRWPDPGHVQSATLGDLPADAVRNPSALKDLKNGSLVDAKLAGDAGLSDSGLEHGDPDVCGGHVHLFGH